MMDPTLSLELQSFVHVASSSPFPMQNLPYGVIRPKGAEPRVAVAIGEQTVDLAVLEAAGLFDDVLPSNGPYFARPALNDFLALGRPTWRAVRQRISQLLRAEEPRLRDDATLRARAFRLRHEVEMCLPAAIGDYTDFYSSKDHAMNVGTMFRGAAQALMPNWMHMPIAYHGRSSSIVTSGTPVTRPCGQTMAEGAERPDFGPSRALDFELEVGFLVGPGTALGEPVPIDRASEHIFGLVLVNDWSARDIQKWEYQPLGPFLGKNFATSISPWVVTLEALAPFAIAPQLQDPEPLPYLRGKSRQAYDVELEVWLRTANRDNAERIACTNLRHLYWTMAQQLAHHTVNGCPLLPGDLMASGTISGPTRSERGSMLELAWKGTEPLRLANGETRSYLADGDELSLVGWARRGERVIGWGEVSGVILPARA